MSGRVDEFTLCGVYQRQIRPSVVPDSIDDLVGRKWVISLSDVEPKAIEGEGMCIVRVG